MTTFPPEPPQDTAESQGHLLLVVLHQPLEGRAQVLVFLPQSLEPPPLPSIGEPELCLLGQGQIVDSVCVLDALRLATRGETLPSILADRLQHDKARLPSLLLGLLQQTFVDERSDSLEHRASQISRNVAPGAAYRLRCFQRTATDEDREAAEEPLLEYI